MAYGGTITIEIATAAGLEIAAPAWIRPGGAEIPVHRSVENLPRAQRSCASRYEIAVVEHLVDEVVSDALISMVADSGAATRHDAAATRFTKNTLLNYEVESRVAVGIRVRDGQAHDFTAIAMVEAIDKNDPPVLHPPFWREVARRRQSRRKERRGRRPFGRPRQPEPCRNAPATQKRKESRNPAGMLSLNGEGEPYCLPGTCGVVDEAPSANPFVPVRRPWPPRGRGPDHQLLPWRRKPGVLCRPRDGRAGRPRRIDRDRPCVLHLGVLGDVA